MQREASCKPVKFRVHTEQWEVAEGFKKDVIRSDVYFEKSFCLQWGTEYNSKAGTPVVSLLESSRQGVVVDVEVEERAGGDTGRIG